ncbi:MAG: hypothetical protein KAY37_07015 [Phycisphaerae bacterium]|nr:hypothetical protein [Phycisphaerae bacterium]
MGSSVVRLLSILAGSLLCSALIAHAFGCDSFRSGSEPLNKSDEVSISALHRRMQAAYPDLASGRFVSLADFEAPEQAAMFRTVGADGSEGDRPQPSLSLMCRRAETGSSSLEALLSGSADRLVLEGRPSDEPALPRDWREYSLLLISIHGPPDGAVVEFSVLSGERTPIRWTRTLAVSSGWTLFRFDLATIGDTIDLSDVRTLTWRTPFARAPVALHLDDLILADNARYLLGEKAGPDELYVFTRGERIHVGVSTRFELAFADGLIVAWKDPGGENLAEIGGLGPWPVPLPADWSVRPGVPVVCDDPDLFTSWGSRVATSQRVVEASSFRVVLEGRRRFVDTPATQPADTPGDDSEPGHTWQYVIYPCGRVHVRVTSTAAGTGWGTPRVGYVVSLNGRQNFQRVHPPAADARGEPVSFVLAARRRARQADLLWTWPRTSGLGRQRELFGQTGRRWAVLVGDITAADVVETAHLLRLWPPDGDTALEGERCAADYQNPVCLAPTAGRLVTNVPGDFDRDGYNESEGCYELALAGDVLRFDFDPGPSMRCDPIFRIHETAGRSCRVYARGRMVRALGRDANNNLLFHLGRLVSSPANIEVHAIPRSVRGPHEHDLPVAAVASRVHRDR